MPHTNNNKGFKALAFLCTLALSACSSTPDQKSIEHSAKTLSQQSIANSQLMQRAKLLMQKAVSQDLIFFAPTYYDLAQEQYVKAQELYKQKASRDEIRMAAYLSIEYVNAGLRNKKLVEEHLKYSLEHRDILLDLEAEIHLPELSTQVEQQHLDVVRLIEQQKLDDIKDAQKYLLRNMHDLEIKVIDTTFLGQAHLMVEQATALEALKIMPQTLLAAQNSLKDAQQFIRQNPRDILKIEEYSQQALFDAERLYSLTRFARQLVVADDNQLESLVLKQEENLSLIREGLIVQDNSNLSLRDQSLLLTQAAKELHEENKRIMSLQGKAAHKDLEKWRRKVVLLQAEVRRLKKIIKDKSKRR